MGGPFIVGGIRIKVFLKYFHQICIKWIVFKFIARKHVSYSQNNSII